MNGLEKLTQDQLKVILENTQQKGESLQFNCAEELINDLKQQIGSYVQVPVE